MWDEFTKLTDFVPPPTSNSPPTPQNSAATKRKTNVMDDEGFIHPAKFSKNLNSKTKITPIINSDNKFETLSNMSDDWQTWITNQSNYRNLSYNPFS